ncbi:hypothetical protein [Sneathiella glossodoripedis]|uniref:hypothetical protein n=1 Tax=Sneathiella glossodoripedis TaxID=418853 RepID=UPI00046F88FE|nr:hypothetical protein [Sneathiella glossodoripedis]
MTSSANIERELNEFLQTEIQGDLVLAEKILSTLAHMKPEPYEFNGNAYCLLVNGERFSLTHQFEEDFLLEGDTAQLRTQLKDWAHSIRAF